ncbi:aminotransferase class V-fold PLP-dependent enzyme [Salinibaculum salinum]|uniref:aminotransferase class V-fold PLP-dependent enzyme n=1 Tax=Salinibaculum salinum TaxID=3131996 RepID=UPI0030ED9F90
MDPETLRADIPALSDCTYLNTGASGPSPTRIVDAISDFQRRHKFDAPCGDGMYQVAADERQRAREAVAGFVGARPEEIALTRNTVEGINHVSTSIEWEPGDIVVRTDLEHPAGELPWERMADRHGIEVRELETESGRLSLEELKTAVADARLLCLSSLSWNYGTRLPIGEVVDIAHDADTLVLVDAVQSPGQVPMDVNEWGADFVAASGHKWLLGAWGAGFLYVDRAVLDDLEPQRIGYFSIDWDATGEGYTYAPDASRFELGTTALGPYVGLAESVALFEELGLDTVQSRIERLTDRLKDGLGDRLLSPREYESGLVSFSVENPDETAERLAKKGIQIRSIPEPNACRASVHVFNTAEDVDRLLDAL